MIQYHTKYRNTIRYGTNPARRCEAAYRAITAVWKKFLFLSYRIRHGKYRRHRSFTLGSSSSHSWCKSRRLQLNANKTEAIWVGSRSNLVKTANSDCSVQVASSKIQPFAVVRDLGLHLGNKLSMKHHVAKVAAICHYHLRHLRQIVSHEVATRLVLETVISRLDYCNAALAGLPQATIAPQQRVQNSVARLIFKLSSREHVTSCLLQLHWLPVRWCVQFKLCCILHSVSYGTCPAYLTNIVESAGAGRTCSGLRSTSLTDYTLPHLRTKFMERPFSYAGPSARNGLSADLCAMADPAEFRKQLETDFFKPLWRELEPVDINSQGRESWKLASFPPRGWPHNPTAGFCSPSTTVVFPELLLRRTKSLRCL